MLLTPAEFYTISDAKNEIEKHKNELLIKSKVDEEVFNYLVDSIFKKIYVVEVKTIEPYRDRSIEIMREIDIDDSPFIALALHLNCPVWSNDKHFKEQNVVKVYTTKEMIELLYED